MKKQQFETYKFGVKTEVLFRGNWSLISEVWFDEGKIGIRETGHLVDYNEIDGIRERS